MLKFCSYEKATVFSSPIKNHSENFTSVIQSIHNQRKLAEELYVVVRATEKKNNTAYQSCWLLRHNRKYTYWKGCINYTYYKFSASL